MANLESRIEEIVDSINDLFSNRTYSREEMADAMEEIGSTCDTNARALREEIKRDAEDA